MSDKCIGNCAICTLEVDKMVCNQIQTLRNIIEVKALLKEMRTNDKNEDLFKNIPNLDEDMTDDTGSIASDTDRVSVHSK